MDQIENLIKKVDILHEDVIALRIDIEKGKFGGRIIWAISGIFAAVFGWAVHFGLSQISDTNSSQDAQIVQLRDKYTDLNDKVIKLEVHARQN